MNLLIWRHAHAEDLQDDQADLDRPLSPKGFLHAQRMGRWLASQLPTERCHMWVSPSKRTRQTARCLQRPLAIVPALAPEADLDQLMTLIDAARLSWSKMQGPVDLAMPEEGPRPTLVLIGHQPQLSQLLARLLMWPEAPGPMRKGAIWWLRSSAQEGPTGRLHLHAYLPPTRVLTAPCT